jgi:tRNA pseudouridine38-40 synthase
MALYQVILAYDGTRFKGYQKQALARTAQGTVEKALTDLGWQGKSILSAGRTDTGVHASGQVISFEMDWQHSPEELLTAANAILPEDIVFREIKEAPPGFHPRYSALGREYRYRILIDPVRDPLREACVWRINEPISTGSLTDSAKILLGENDFAAYGTPPRAGSSTIRTINLSEWNKVGREWCYTIIGNAFLYHMVRRLVFIQVQAARRGLSADEFRSKFREGFLRTPGLAPAKGLTLTEVIYMPRNNLGIVERKSIGEDESGKNIRPER